eukprot:TRINITY_DN15609_c0_g1_i1.p1 TRINITY_DN15609_c0_g1~~TRINITY_DN15609_c0_g1_i1.p1  ORF type:complete len:300 (+),score=1.15 TRINITY_DN15609_c0_g1_i1:124-900(+)
MAAAAAIAAATMARRVDDPPKGAVVVVGDYRCCEGGWLGEPGFGVTLAARCSQDFFVTFGGDRAVACVNAAWQTSHARHVHRNRMRVALVAAFCAIVLFVVLSSVDLTSSGGGCLAVGLTVALVFSLEDKSSLTVFASDACNSLAQEMPGFTWMWCRWGRLSRRIAWVAKPMHGYRKMLLDNGGPPVIGLPIELCVAPADGVAIVSPRAYSHGGVSGTATPALSPTGGGLMPASPVVTGYLRSPAQLPGAAPISPKSG